MSTTTTDRRMLRTRKQRELEAVRAQLTSARWRLRSAAIEYAATSDGACETYRRFELAGGAERDELRAIYLAGLSMAEQEYRERVALGHAGSADGPLGAIAVGSFDDPVARVLVEHRVMGWVRTGPAALESGQLSVGLIRLLPDGRTRRRLRVRCAADPLLGVLTSTLTQIVVGAWADTAMRDRVGDLLGLEAVDALSVALAGARR